MLLRNGPFFNILLNIYLAVLRRKQKLWIYFIPKKVFYKFVVYKCLQNILTKEPGAGFYVSLLSGSFVHIFQRLYSTFIFIKHNLSYERYLKPMLLLKNVSWIYNKIWTKEPFSFRLPITALDTLSPACFNWVDCD